LSFYRINMVRISTETCMTAKFETAENLLAALAWQHDMGIDEVICDDPATGMTLALRDLSGGEGTPSSQAGLAHPTANGAGPSAPSGAEAGSVADTGSGTLAQPVNNGSANNARDPSPATHDDRQPLDDSLSEITSLDALKAALGDLDSCALKHTASNMVFSDGNPGARLMIIGDVPGREEDRVGLPLVGTAGQLFDRMLASISLTRADVYIAPLIPWRPPGNRTPTSEEMDMLLPWLHRHIQLADPAFVMVLGGGAAKALIPGAGSILKTRGKWAGIDFGDGKERHVMASLHPEYLLRSPAQKRLAWADLLALAGKLL
jgi:DNA polymerase